jgi:hypothetical protein
MPPSKIITVRGSLRCRMSRTAAILAPETVGRGGMTALRALGRWYKPLPVSTSSVLVYRVYLTGRMH